MHFYRAMYEPHIVLYSLSTSASKLHNLNDARSLLLLCVKIPPADASTCFLCGDTASFASASACKIGRVSQIEKGTEIQWIKL